MKKSLAIFFCFFFFAAIFNQAFAQTDALPNKREKKAKEKPAPLSSHVILFLVDGLRLEALKNSQLNLPALKSTFANGAHILNLESVYPSQTLPATASLLTGMFPADHHIVAERLFDEKKALTTFSPPENLLANGMDSIWYAARRDLLKISAFNVPFSNEVEFNPKQFDDALELIKTSHPNLLAIRFEEYANALQQKGVQSVEAKAALEKIDAAIQKVFTQVEKIGLANEMSYLIVSTHGFANVEQQFFPNTLLARKGFLKADEKGNITDWIAVANVAGGSAAIYLKDQQNAEAAKSIEAVFAEIYAQEASPIWKIVSKQDAIKMGADPRAAFFIEAAPGFIMSEKILKGKKLTEKISAGDSRAVAGYLPSRSEMRGFLLAAGKGIKSQKQIEYARIVDIAPTIARLLGLELKASRGHAISSMLNLPTPK